MYELVMGHGIKSQGGDDVPGGARPSGIHAADVHRVLSPDGELQMEIRETGGSDLLPEPVQRLPGFFDAAQPPHEVHNVVDHEDRTAVDLVIVRPGEVLFDHPVRDGLKFGPGLGTEPDGAAPIADPLVPEKTGVVVGPHEIELHLSVVRRAEESIVQTLFEEGPAVVPVPVVDEHVHAVGERFSDLEFHDGGIGFVLRAPERSAGQDVVRASLLCGKYGLPFSVPLRPEGDGTRLFARVGGPDISGDVVMFHGAPRCFFVYYITAQKFCQFLASRVGLCYNENKHE